MRTRLGLSRTQLGMALLLAIVLVVMAFLQNQPETIEPYDPEESSSSGLRALVLWLEELGYPVSLHERETPIPDDAGLLWIYPSDTINVSEGYEQEIANIYQWVEEGGTLVLVGPTMPYTPLSTRFGVEQVENFTSMVSDLQQVQPLLPTDRLNEMPSEWDSFAAPHSLFFTEERAIVPIIAHTNGEPAVAIQHIGDGVVWHLTEDFAQTNLNLRDERVAQLLPAILRTVPEGASVLFTTDHLIRYDPAVVGEVTSLQDWLYTTPFGQATLLVLVSAFVYLLLQGRRLGPAMPGPTASRPREAAEYVSALAGLQRRMRQPNLVADHHRQRLKSAVGKLAQLPADLPDAEWLRQLQRADVLSPALFNEVNDLLIGYALLVSNENGNANGKPTSKTNDEADLIQLVRATDALLATLPRANMQLVR